MATFLRRGDDSTYEICIRGIYYFGVPEMCVQTGFWLVHFFKALLLHIREYFHL